MPKFIATGWFQPTGFLFKIPTELLKTRSGIMFYSEWNKPEEITKLKKFKNSLVIRLEDIPEAGDNNIGPTPEKMILIKDFIEAHLDTDFVVSCFAGISRTGAIIDYLKEIHHYELDLNYMQYNNIGFCPNELMQKYFNELNPQYIGHQQLDYDLKNKKWEYDIQESTLTKNIF